MDRGFVSLNSPVDYKIDSNCLFAVLSPIVDVCMLWRKAETLDYSMSPLWNVCD